jgi:hypothetical protein
MSQAAADDCHSIGPDRKYGNLKYKETPANCFEAVANENRPVESAFNWPV